MKSEQQKVDAANTSKTIYTNQPKSCLQINIYKPLAQNLIIFTTFT